MFLIRANRELINAATLYVELRRKFADDTANDESLERHLAKSEQGLERAAMSFAEAANEAGEKP